MAAILTLDTSASIPLLGAILGILVTALLLSGPAEQRDQTILRMGIDSAAMLVCYAVGLVLLRGLRGSS
jgi:cation:H+ antiporter